MVKREAPKKIMGYYYGISARSAEKLLWDMQILKKNTATGGSDHIFRNIWPIFFDYFWNFWKRNINHPKTEYMSSGSKSGTYSDRICSYPWVFEIWLESLWNGWKTVDSAPLGHPMITLHRFSKILIDFGRSGCLSPNKWRRCRAGPSHCG